MTTTQENPSLEQILSDTIDKKISKTIKELQKIEGIKILNFSKKTGHFKIELPIQGKQPIYFKVDTVEATLQSKVIPKITPPCYLQVEKVLLSNDYNVNSLY